LEQALKIFVMNLKDAETKLGVDHPTTLICRGSLAVAFQNTAEVDKALPLLERNLQLSIAKLGEEHPDTIIVRVNYATALEESGDLPKALQILETVVGQAQRAFGPDHPRTLQITQIWCDSLDSAKEWDRSIKTRQEILAKERQRGKQDSSLGSALAKLGKTLVLAKRFVEAEPLLRESLAICAKTQPDVWTTFDTQSQLGGALLGQKKHAEAEPLLLKGYEGMKAREKTIPPAVIVRIPEALDRLVELYTATNKPDEVKKWRAERAKYPTPKEVAPPQQEKK
jgi:tetratricopeptide (TPR) repeat protein